MKNSVLRLFGYETPEDLDCANVETAIDEIFQNDFSSDPASMIEHLQVNGFLNEKTVESSDDRNGT